MAKEIVMHGIDLSHWNRVSNWHHIAKSVDFVMLKIGGEEGAAGDFNPDPVFLQNYYHAVKAGLHVGGYFFAGNKEEIICASDSAIEKMCRTVHRFLVDNKILFDMPLALDFENQYSDMRYENTHYVATWCKAMERLNYYVTIYASDVSGFLDVLNLDGLKEFDKWVARYGGKPEIVTHYGMWQHTNVGHVLGVSGEVDKNYAYLDYPEIISRKGLNR